MRPRSAPRPSPRSRRIPRLRHCGALLAVVGLPIAVASCGDDATVPEVPEPTSVRLDANALDFVSIGDQQTVVATVLDQDGVPMGGVSLTWSSDDDAVATVSNRGEVVARANGSTTVRVRAGTAEATLPVAVAQAVHSFLVGADSVVLGDPGDTVRIAAEAFDAAGVPVTDAVVAWVSRDTAVVSITAGGAVEARATGVARVVATAGGVSDSLTVRVEPELAIEAVGTLPVTATVATEVSLAARVEDVLGAPYAGASVLWSTGAGSGAIVSEQLVESDGTGSTGAVWRLGQTAGTQRAFAQIETRGRTEVVEFLASAEPGPAVTAALVADSILLSARGEAAFLAPTYADEFGNTTAGSGVGWSTSESLVATVSADGLVTGGVEGSAWIVGALGGSGVDSILVTVVHRGAITITFDDGFLSVYENAWPLLQEFDLPANIAVNPIPVDQGWGDYMTRPMLDEVHDAGWSIVSHTLRHDSLTTLTPAELDFDLRTTQQWIIDGGYNGWNVFVAPYHDYGPAERTAVAGYYEASRGVSSNIVSPDSLVAWRPDRPHELTGREADFLPYTTPAGRAELRTLLQRTLDEGAFLDLFFHRIPVANVDELRAMLEVVDDFRDRVLPYHELFPIWARSVY